MLIDAEHHRLALVLWNLHRHGFALEEARRMRRLPTLLRAQRKDVLVGTRNVELGRHVLGRVGHRVDAVTLLHQLVDEAPANRRVLDLRRARERTIGLREHERRARHALDAAGNDQVGFAGGDRVCRQRNRVETGPAQPVDRGTRHLHRQASKQRRPDWRNRRSRRRSATGPWPDCGPPARESAAPPGRRCARSRAHRRSGQTAYARHQRSTHWL
jgi:hypothetical protein